MSEITEKNLLKRVACALAVFFVFSFVEPLFELLCLYVHNFVFYHIANIQFSGVSIGSLLGFILGGVRSQYLLLLPISAALAFILALWRFGGNLRFRSVLFAALYIVLLVTFILLFTRYRMLHLNSLDMLISYVISVIYWLFSVSFTWLIAVSLDII